MFLLFYRMLSYILCDYLIVNFNTSVAFDKFGEYQRFYQNCDFSSLSDQPRNYQEIYM